MKFGMVKVAAVTPVIRVGDVAGNAKAVIAKVKELKERGVEIAVFPELCVTGYTLADLLFFNDTAVAVNKAIKDIAAAVPSGMIVFFGAPVAVDSRLYNCAVAASGGRVLGLVPKTYLPEYGEFFEKRYFTPAFDGVIDNTEFGAPMGKVIFSCKTEPKLKVAAEICEDMWADVPPSADACRAGATVAVNLSASDEVVGKAEYRRLLVSSTSGRQHCAYVYADAGQGESTTDAVFSGHNIIAENGGVLAESAPFESGLAITDIDVERLDAERLRIGMSAPACEYKTVEFELNDGIALDREVEPYPFVPKTDISARAELILNMQSHALATRLNAIGKNTAAVVGVSGGLDSTLALLVCARATDKDKVVAVTMPAFGTTEKTKNNAVRLCEALGVKVKTIDIRKTVISHLADLSHRAKDTVYENAQARTRTMTLFDIANKVNGLVVGTGDLSELALGWATYNGDHMSSYGVNAGIPKTLVKFLVRHEAERLGGEAAEALYDILGTDISPELLPPEDGKIVQKTEDILGKYDLHDFIIYYYVRFGFSREKIAFLLERAFPNVEKAERDKALETFYKRFFAAQFKRSCLPDGVKIGSVSFSPRSDWRMPSDIK